MLFFSSMFSSLSVTCTGIRLGVGLSVYVIVVGNFWIVFEEFASEVVSIVSFKYPPSVLLECMIIVGFFDNLGIRPRIIKSAD